MRSCIHVGFVIFSPFAQNMLDSQVGGNGSRHRRTKSAERRTNKQPKRISWNLTPRGEVPTNSQAASTAQSLPPEPPTPVLPPSTIEGELPQTPTPSPASPYVSPSPYAAYFESRHLLPRNPPQYYSYSTPASPAPSRKLPTPPAFQHSILSPQFRY